MHDTNNYVISNGSCIIQFGNFTKLISSRRFRHRGRTTERKTAVMSAKIAGAPISWGVVEVPGWGHQMSQDRVLNEMTELGYSACEFGPLGFLPVEAAGRVATLREHGLSAVGGFVPVVLHVATHDPKPEIRAELEVFKAAGADAMVLAASTGSEGYDNRPVLTDAEWQTLFTNLHRTRDARGRIWNSRSHSPPHGNHHRIR